MEAQNEKVMGWEKRSGMEKGTGTVRIKGSKGKGG